MNQEITRSSIITSLLWKLTERVGTQGVQFLITIILARLLLPEQFGLIVLVTIFISIAGVFVQSGFNIALVQKKNTDEIDFSSVFYLSIFISFLLYLVLFFIAPYIAAFFQEEQLVLTIRVLSITLILGAMNSIQMAYIARNMLFQKLFISSIGAISISGIIGIFLAFNDYGVWALVSQQLSNQLIITLILWFTVEWRPKLVFSFLRIKGLFSFGWKLLVSSLIDVIYKNITSLIIGRLYSPAILGYYNRGEQFPNLIVSNINGSIQAVMLPALSSYQENTTKVKSMVKHTNVASSFIIFPMMFGLAAVAEPFISLILTNKWLPAVPFLQIFCLSYAFWPIHTTNLQAINALGRSDLYLKLELIKKILGLFILFLSIQFGVMAIALGVLINSILSTFINAYPNLQLINYGFHDQIKDVMPSLSISITMGIVVYNIKYLEMTDLMTLIAQLITGVIIYFSLSRIFKTNAFSLFVEVSKKYKQKKFS